MAAGGLVPDGST